ncbi:unnamed protein product [Pseudo-nitzschia multistriata]|uniref:Sulfhydryl oxidase n=1 Tax=Pseudo-nitzschia multistriata TaxID=183589 RepID=A0A448Z494_9STRA|nr:unnamed protein product [Pseudo-nitzschia multistriata]
MQPVVRDLLKNFDAIVMEPMALNKIMGNHPPPGPISKWSRASSQHGTGYTAGLWILFHIMSVGLVKWNHLATDDGQMIIPAAMADIQRNYVEHFFQCEECRLNFLSDFDACMFDRCNRLITLANGGTLEQFIQYPLWLYETHNGVNVRLRNERIEQGIESESFTTQAEISWPPASSCPLCWLSREKDRWDELEVYKFLEQSYWLEDDDVEVLRMLSESGVAIEEKKMLDHSMVAENYSDKLDLYSTVPWCCFVLILALVRYRKKKYNLRGIHKKIESDNF